MAPFRRIPVANTVRRSPFELLLEHAGIVKKGSAVMKKAFRAYMEGKYDEVRKLGKSIDEMELEADKLKSNIRNHLPSNILMPVDKGHFLILLSEQDKVLDVYQDIINWMLMREKSMDSRLGEMIQDLFEKTEETVDTYEKAISNLNILIETSFAEKERKKTKEIIYRIHELENQCDEIERKAIKYAFSLEDRENPIAIYHAIHLAIVISSIADHAENAADRLRAMMAK